MPAPKLEMLSELPRRRPPNFGGVNQSSNVDGTNVTTDTTRTVFNGQDVEVIVTHEGSISTTLSTETDFVLSNTGTAPSPIRPGYSHQQRTVGNIVGDDITIAVVETDWDPGNPTDYATFGYWLKVKDYSTPSPRPQIGAFLDGPEFRGSPIVPASGSASYRGRSQGFYVGVAGSNTLIPTGSLATGEFFADATLVANFGTSMIGGTIDNIETVESAVSPQGQVLYLNQPGTADYLLTLGNTPIGNGKFVGTTNLSSLSRSVTSSDGKWGGQSSNRPMSATEGDPRLVGGTFGGGFTEADGSQATYIGVFGATKQ